MSPCTGIITTRIQSKKLSMKKIRVYELARELNIESRALVDDIKSIGVVVSSYQSVLSADQVEKIKIKYGVVKESTSIKKRVVIKRRKKAPEPAQIPLESEESLDDSQLVESSPSDSPSSAETVTATIATDTDTDANSADLAPHDQELLADESAAESSSDRLDSTSLTDSSLKESRFSKVAQHLAHQRSREEKSNTSGIRSAKVITKAADNTMFHQDVSRESSTPESPSSPPRFREPQLGATKGSKAEDDDVLKRSVVKKSKRSQFNPRDLLWSVEQEDSYVRHTRKKTVYSPMGTKNRDHRRRKDLKKTQITTPKASIRVVEMAEATLSVGELARQLSMKAAELISHLMKDGVMATVNERLDIDTVTLVASQFDYDVKVVFKTAEDILARPAPDPQSLISRPPVVTFMGHVDHGKTSLLDAIRQGSICDSEEGGITQHIGAYMVDHKGEKITFLDTPGHAAFSSIRGRGVKVTDIVVLVVAADDGVMPQTIEAISHAKNGEVPIIVALNKMDRPTKNLDRIFSELSEHGIQAEEWGGDHQFVKLSALEKTGCDDLLEAIVLQAELLELKASHSAAPQGVIIEAHMDVGRGPVVTIMVSDGVFSVGDEIVAGSSLGRIRAMKNDQGARVSKATPSTPVEIEGLGELPMVGDLVDRVVDREQAKAVVAARRAAQSRKDRQRSPISTLEELIAKVDSQKILSVPFIIKADTQGSLQAITEALGDIKSDKVVAKVVHKGVGAINASDIALAQVSDSVILAFNVRLSRTVDDDEDTLGVVISYFSVIYELIDSAEALLAGSLPPIQNEVVIGRAEIRKLISVPKIGMVAGSSVSDGRIARHCHLRLIRDDVVIHDGKLGSLRRFKDDVKEVTAGFECGISFDSYKDLKEGDLIEAYEIEEIKATL